MIGEGICGKGSTQVMQFRRVSKRFLMRQDRPRSFQELVLGVFQRTKSVSQQPLWAVEDVSFCVQAGETVAIIGRNGSGKSTCLKLMTRILTPTCGEVIVKGRVSGILELGAGFHPELTGRDNIYLNGSLMGLSRDEIRRRFDEIVSFSELERFIDVQIKSYSSGMVMRLGFAIAISVDPDILLVDEVLAVGDQAFQQKCLVKIEDIKKAGATIVFVSHALDQVAALCQRALWMDRGRLLADGPCRDVLDRYLECLHREDQGHHEL